MNKKEILLEKIFFGGMALHRWDNFKCLSCGTKLSLLQCKLKRKGKKFSVIPLVPTKCPICGKRGKTKFQKTGYRYNTYSGEILLEKKLKERVKKKGGVE